MHDRHAHALGRFGIDEEHDAAHLLQSDCFGARPRQKRGDVVLRRVNAAPAGDKVECGQREQKKQDDQPDDDEDFGQRERGAKRRRDGETERRSARDPAVHFVSSSLSLFVSAHLKFVTSSHLLNCELKFVTERSEIPNRPSGPAVQRRNGAVVTAVSLLSM